MVTPQPITIFYSYADADEALQEMLEKHLAIMRKQRYIDDWDKRRISPGVEWAGEVNDHLNTADIILLLISADFLASDYCYDVELARAMERHRAGNACVIPVILRHVDWDGAPFRQLKVLPTGGKPVTSSSWTSHDEAFRNIAEGIRAVIEARRSPRIAGNAFRRHYGAHIHKLCDRHAQDDAFRECFRTWLQQHPHSPQVYLLHGTESDRAESFVERLRLTHIQHYADAHWNPERSAVRLMQIAHWPTDGSVARRQKRLGYALFGAFDPTYEHKHDDFSAKAFAHVAATEASPVVVLQHTIDRWDHVTHEVLAWYLRFWDAVGRDTPTPQFLIFISVFYPRNTSAGWWKIWRKWSRFNKKRIQRTLEAFDRLRQEEATRTSAPRPCPCLLLPELTCIDQEAVERWFRAHNLCDDLQVREDRCRALFRGHDCRPMADVERALKAMCREFEARGGY